MGCVPPALSTFDSRIENVEVAEEVTRQYAESVGFHEPEQYLIGLALREVFINAIKHGNRFDESKKVVLQLSNPNGAMAIEVTDQGQGFHLSDVPNPRAPENLHRGSGRGLLMAERLMDELHVDSGVSRGTHIRMLKRLAKR